MYKVRYTANETGKSVVEHYRTARRAEECVERCHTVHAKANTTAEYLGKV